ncbi:GntR family transcriptional regulator [Rhizobium ruizarguesonis]|uniref:GntR family transcriptional regulator n=1 Tax=Rhizobium ruizarguesonis TaxID=2081791 RepID=UPI0013C1BF1E|nr:GntR family transcriptional regulator [Rhizobium ruizarguesonis]MBC2806757.1 GntR family transcriptional regulator [Rhizobium ruizarguesonis]MBY5878438.1 GntR family transcriptional regulator [Rhizobium leguminosarum]NEJ02888.1 FCD domain-containing protein [Rhizobium ruizarguesonis]NEJ39944.1 FCD domain-containing protein [Rhizobium ruizarguesonis]
MVNDRPIWEPKITKDNLSDRAYLELREALMSGYLLPGERLLLRPMSKRFGISATPMREAFLKLISIDALRLDSRGTVIVPTLTTAELTEIRDIRIDLEGRGAAVAALVALPCEIDTLEAIQARILASHDTDSFVDAVKYNTEFHLTLCKMSRLPILQGIVENLWVRCGPILARLYESGVPDWNPHPHEHVLKALRDRDPDRCRAAIQFDIIDGSKGLLR